MDTRIRAAAILRAAHYRTEAKLLGQGRTDEDKARKFAASVCLCMRLVLLVLFFGIISSEQCRADVTAEQVNAAIKSGIAFLERQQQPSGAWSEMPTEPRGVTALCTLALLNCGRTTEDESVKRALAYLEKAPEPDRTYSVAISL